MTTTSKWLGIVAVAFVAGSVVASPELRAFAANTVGSTDIINESILSEDIKNSQVKASDIATDAVGAAEIAGVTKLLFAVCNPDDHAGQTIGPTATIMPVCTISGVDSSDSAIATLKGNNNICAVVQSATAGPGQVTVYIKGVCTANFNAGDRISIIVYDK